jgi:hypothetical protein
MLLTLAKEQLSGKLNAIAPRSFEFRVGSQANPVMLSGFMFVSVMADMAKQFKSKISGQSSKAFLSRA